MRRRLALARAERVEDAALSLVEFAEEYSRRSETDRWKRKQMLRLAREYAAAVRNLGRAVR